jgi:hypothetical protein
MTRVLPETNFAGKHAPLPIVKAGQPPVPNVRQFALSSTVNVMSGVSCCTALGVAPPPRLLITAHAKEALIKGVRKASKRAQRHRHTYIRKV